MELVISFFLISVLFIRHDSCFYGQNNYLLLQNNLIHD